MAFGNATKGYVKKHSGGGGGGGTSNYNQLTNKPQINGVELTGNKSTSDLGITGVELKELTVHETSPVASYIMPENYTLAIFIFKKGSNIVPLVCPKALLDNLTVDKNELILFDATMDTYSNALWKDGNYIKEAYASSNMYRLVKVYYI